MDRGLLPLFPFVCDRKVLKRAERGLPKARKNDDAVCGADVDG